MRIAAFVEDLMSSEMFPINADGMPRYLKGVLYELSSVSQMPRILTATFTSVLPSSVTQMMWIV